MKKIVIALAIAMILIPMHNSFAMELSKDQKAVWTTIEKHWEYFKSEDTENFLKSFHPRFKGYVNWRALPLDKENLGKWIEWMNKGVDILVYTIEPVSINIFDDVAVVQYYCNISFKTSSGQVRSEYRYTDVLKKEKKNWLVIGAHKEKMN
jgi:hypothetical protein